MAKGGRSRNLARRMSRHYLKHFSQVIECTRMGGRAVEGTGLENPFTPSVLYPPTLNSPGFCGFLAGGST